MNKKDIRNFTIDELKRELGKMRESSYRAGQIFYWIYKKGARDFDGMTNIPKALKDKLSKVYCIDNIELKERLKSSDDGSEKFLFKLSDGHCVESVLICSRARKTLCLSTQVGCKYGCAFCASGMKGFARNLKTSEILGQILFLEQTLAHKITNFVFMGMGEPLDNYENVSKAIMIMNYANGLEIGARRITVSTCGLASGIERLKDLGIQVNLSVSLHAANDKLRDSLVPVNKIYPLEKLLASCRDFIDATGRKMTLEYVLIKGKNDSHEDAAGLSRIARKLYAKVNLIPCSPVPNRKFEAPSKRNMEIFKSILIKNKINATVRESKGKDIQAACGQLALKSTP